MEKNKLIWIGKMKRRSGNEVSISCKINGTGDKHLACFTFREDCFKDFTKSTFFEIAFSENRMYFRESDEEHGIRLLEHPEVVSTTRYAKIQNGFAKNLVAWNGNFELKYDEEWELYYIERKDN